MITVAGLGPGSLAGTPAHVRQILTDPGLTVIARTSQHPAAAELAEMREIIFCDDLYESCSSFEEVYTAIAERVLTAAEDGDLIYVVPGSPLLGELVVQKLLASGEDVTIEPAASFLDALLGAVGYDPLERGLQILNAHDLPDPLVLDKPTVIAQVDMPEVLADTLSLVDGLVAEGTNVIVLRDLGLTSEEIIVVEPDGVPAELAGLRTSLFIDPVPGGLIGAVHTMRLLREECPWDREQTHDSLVKNLVEEAYELIDAIRSLPPDGSDIGAYAEVEDELGDVLLQVLFHEAIARERGVFDIDSAAEGLRQKLVRRHPHVFSNVAASTPEEVKANWDRIKEVERGDPGGSAMDGIPTSMPALFRAAKVQNRAAKVGFDWDSPRDVIPKLREELAEMEGALGDPDAEIHELGDLLITVVNLARHLEIDPEGALQMAVDRMEARFRRMEAEGPLQGLSLEELDERWERAKG